MRVLFINNDGGGFADHINVEDGTTVSGFFGEQMPNRDPGSYLIRVNRQPVAKDQELQNGDRISFTPTKIEGAGARR
jgi:sulfur carrier protein ThiS